MFHQTTVGLAEVGAGLQSLADAVKRTMVRRAVRKASLPIRDLAKSRARRQSGTMADSIIVTTKAQGHGDSIIHAYIGPQTKVRVPVRLVSRGKHKGKMRIAIPTLYAPKVEFGHAIVVKGKVVGHVAPYPFMRPAWEAHGGDKALTIIEVDMKEQIANWKPKP